MDDDLLSVYFIILYIVSLGHSVQLGIPESMDCQIQTSFQEILFHYLKVHLHTH